MLKSNLSLKVVKKGKTSQPPKFIDSILCKENNKVLELYERVDVEKIDKLRYSKKLREDSTRDKNMIGLLDMYPLTD